MAESGLSVVTLEWPEWQGVGSLWSRDNQKGIKMKFENENLRGPTPLKQVRGWPWPLVVFRSQKKPKRQTPKPMVGPQEHIQFSQT